ncbi:MAG TPA: N-acetylmuramoyl-L-alanine amidase [Pyrinomonadaceae bacterium]|jgi:N-acetylmuramoyl-L-alanine amidase
MAGKKGTIVIDPGHGGSAEVGGSSHNNARSPSGVLEKNLTLRMAFLVREALQHAATIGGHTVKIILTRETDKNLGLAARARVAKDNSADLFLCIHFNASETHKARGVETLVDRKTRPNPKHAADVGFAQKVQTAVFNAIKAHDPKTRDRGVKDQGLMVLNHAHLGSKARGCLCEVEFLDHPAADELLNLGLNATQVRQDIATAMANALIAAL